MLKILKWTARILSLISISILLLFIFGEEGSGKAPASNEIILLIFFPTGILIGLIAAFKYPLTGGLIALLSLVLFYTIHYIFKNDFPGGAAFLVFTSPALLFLAYSLLQKNNKHKPV